MIECLKEWSKEWQFWMALASIFGGLFSVYKYFKNRKTKQQQQEFENYHKLIERINGPLSSNENTFLQVQQAAIFELRHYKRYKKLTIKLLQHWVGREKYKDFVDDTLDYLRK